jgi:hypothetical protein
VADRACRGKVEAGFPKRTCDNKWIQSMSRKSGSRLCEKDMRRQMDLEHGSPFGVR